MTARDKRETRLVTITVSLEELQSLRQKVERDIMMSGIGFASRDIKSEIAERVIRAALDTKHPPPPLDQETE